MLAYTAWSYYIFRKRISQTAVPEGIKSMIDKDILQMPKIKNFVLLAGFSFLQAVFIIGQAFSFKAIVGLLSGGHLNQQLQSILLFLFLSWSTCYYVFS